MKRLLLQLVQKAGYYIRQARVPDPYVSEACQLRTRMQNSRNLAQLARSNACLSECDAKRLPECLAGIAQGGLHHPNCHHVVNVRLHSPSLQNRPSYPDMNAVVRS